MRSRGTDEAMEIDLHSRGIIGTGGWMTMIKAVFASLTVLLLSIALAGCAQFGIEPGIKAEVVMKSGDTVRLFSGGTEEAKALFCVGETVSVFRAQDGEESRYREVGKIKILRPVGEHYLEGVVVEGAVKEGDLARKSIAACLVVPRRPPGN